jgi:DNA-binding NarL/FixJ family response regulator
MPAYALPPIRVLVADDSPLIRQTIARIFRDESKLTFVGEAESYSTLLECADETKPDVVLMDINMPGRLQFTPTFIKERLSGIPVVCMSIWQDEPTHRRAQQFGGALIDKAMLQSALLPAIEAVMRPTVN